MNEKPDSEIQNLGDKRHAVYICIQIIERMEKRLRLLESILIGVSVMSAFILIPAIVSLIKVFIAHAELMERMK